MQLGHTRVKGPATMRTWLPQSTQLSGVNGEKDSKQRPMRSARRTTARRTRSGACQRSGFADSDARRNAQDHLIRGSTDDPLLTLGSCRYGASSLDQSRADATGARELKVAGEMSLDDDSIGPLNEPQRPHEGDGHQQADPNAAHSIRNRSNLAFVSSSLSSPAASDASWPLLLSGGMNRCIPPSFCCSNLRP